MLGYVVAEGPGVADGLICDAALRLQAEGLSLAGAVQVNIDTDPARKCLMELHILSGRETIRISQDLGRLADGCRLDPDGLERAVGLVAGALAAGADCLVVNKFGKQEAEGRGFRSLIGDALSAGIPVLTAVNAGQVDTFLAFAEDLAMPLPADASEIAAWCRARAPAR